MIEMDVRTRKMTEKTATYTSDVQTAELEYTFTYDLNPKSVHILYETVGQDYEAKKPDSGAQRRPQGCDRQMAGAGFGR